MPEQHLCHAVGCNVRTLPNRLMCPPHWFMVPPEIRRRVWQLYRPGQEEDHAPSQPYIDAAREAINAVARQENQPELPDDASLIKTIEAMLAKEKDKDNGSSI